MMMTVKLLLAVCLAGSVASAADEQPLGEACLDALQNHDPDAGRYNWGIYKARTLPFMEYSWLMARLDRATAEKIIPTLSIENTAYVFGSASRGNGAVIAKAIQQFRRQGRVRSLGFHGSISSFQAKYIAPLKPDKLTLHNDEISSEVLETLLNSCTDLEELRAGFSTPFTAKEIEVLLDKSPNIQSCHIKLVHMTVEEIRQLPPGLKNIPELYVGFDTSTTIGEYVELIQHFKTATGYPLEIRKQIPFVRTRQALSVIKNQTEWEEIWQKEGKKAPKVNFRKHVVATLQYDTNDINSQRVHAAEYRDGYRLISMSTAVGGRWIPSGEYHTTFFVLDRLFD